VLNSRTLPNSRVPALLVAIGVAAIVAIGVYVFFSSSHTRVSKVPAVPAPGGSVSLPSPHHVVIVIEENKSYAQIIGNRAAPYINRLAARGALFTQSYGIAHPSQPNYLALFSGRPNRNGDSCVFNDPRPDAPNIGSELIAAHRTFVGFAEGLPAPGSTACSAGQYARKHAPWTHFTNVPAEDSKPLTALGDYAALPTLAYVVPDVLNDMHSASIERGDAWLQRTLEPLVTWAMHNDTLVILTWDESSAALTNHIPTIFIGPMVQPGRYSTTVSHYRVLRTIEEFYHVPALGGATSVAPITEIWEKR